MRPNSNKLVKPILLAAVLLVIPSLLIAAQSAPNPVNPADPPEPPEVTRVMVTVVPLSLENQQLADQYLEAIEQLENVINDYVIYFEKFNREKLREYQISFETFAHGLESGLYSQDPTHLAHDLDEYIDLLRGNEARLRASNKSRDKKLYRLIRGLRRELAVVLDLIEDAITSQDEQKVFAESFRVYVSHQLRESEIRFPRVKPEGFARQYEQALKNYLESLEILSEQSQLEALEFLEQIEALEGMDLVENMELLIELSLEQQKEVLKALESIELDFTRDNEPVIVYTHKKHDAMAPMATIDGIVNPGPKKYHDSNVRSFNGSLGISSRQMPVYITHPRGELHVTGWNESVVSAELYVVVDAPTEKDRDAFLESVKLKMGQDKDGYFAETVFPRLTNPNLRVVESVLRVKVPSQNRVICNHSFGEVTVKRLNFGALIKGNNSSITASYINGRLKIENSLGTINVNRIDGSVQISNTSGQIFISECSARGKVSSSAGLISLSDSYGDFTLVNSGPINVVDHTGNVDIENYNGSVTLLNITGNVSVYSTLQPIIVENIEGRVILENRNADIKAYQISESLEASTSHANIEAGWIGDQFELRNDHGNITLEIGTEPSNTSKVSSTSGHINLIVSSDSDLLVTATANDGSISSDFPMNLSADGPVKSARILIGKGSNRLILKSVHGSIRIEEL